MPDEPDSRRSSFEGGGNAALWLDLDIVEEVEHWSTLEDVERLVQEAGRALAASPRFSDLAPAEACVALSDDAAVHELNRRYRGKDAPTNVLSFPAPDIAFPENEAGPRPLGDLVLAYETLVREARDQDIPLAHHLQHLVVHGLLHLLGFDHETDREAEEMEAIEVEILAGLGISNPYHETISSVSP